MKERKESKQIFFHLRQAPNFVFQLQYIFQTQNVSPGFQKKLKHGGESNKVQI